MTTLENAVARLPRRYEPLLLTFRQAPFEIVDTHAVIGDDEGTEIRVQIGSGHVVSIGVDPLPSRFVNSSIDQLAQSIDAYESYVSRVRRVDDEVPARQLVQELRLRIGNIDPAATAEPETWWSVIFEQAEEGLL